jgi:hypothetical protein
MCGSSNTDLFVAPREVDFKKISITKKKKKLIKVMKNKQAMV